MLRRQWRPVLIQMDGPRPLFSQTVNIDVPGDVVPGTLTLSVGVVGTGVGVGVWVCVGVGVPVYVCIYVYV